MKQRKPREDQERDQDSIRRYEIGTDIDGDAVVCKVDDNVLSLHEPADKHFESPKFQFVFQDAADMRTFVKKIEAEIGNTPAPGESLADLKREKNGLVGETHVSEKRLRFIILDLKIALGEIERGEHAKPILNLESARNGLVKLLKMEKKPAPRKGNGLIAGLVLAPAELEQNGLFPWDHIHALHVDQDTCLEGTRCVHYAGIGCTSKFCCRKKVE